MGAGSGIVDLGELGKTQILSPEQIELTKLNLLTNLAAATRAQVLMTMALVQMMDAYRLDRKGGKAKDAETMVASAQAFTELAMATAGFTRKEETPDGKAQEEGVADQPPAVRGEGDGLGQHSGGDSGGGVSASHDGPDDHVARSPEDGPQD